MIKQKESHIHWNYFLALEKDLIEISRFIELSTMNNNTYSIEIAKLLFAAASEFDVVTKLLCKLLAEEMSRENINDYKVIISEKKPEIIEEKVFINRYGLEFQPLENWENGNNPDWWRSYNNVKHNSTECYEEANLKNTLNAMGALLIVITYYYQIKFSNTNKIISLKEVSYRLQSQPELIRLNEDRYHFNMVGM